MSRHGPAEDELSFLALLSSKRELVAIVDAKSAELLRIAALRPW